MPITHHGFVRREENGHPVFDSLWGFDTSGHDRGARETARQIDNRLVAQIQDEHGMPRVISLLEEIRDRLAGVRPTIHVPTADECRRFGGKEVR